MSTSVFKTVTVNTCVFNVSPNSCFNNIFHLLFLWNPIIHNYVLISCLNFVLRQYLYSIFVFSFHPEPKSCPHAAITKPGSDEIMHMRSRYTQEEFLVLFIELNTPLLNRNCAYHVAASCRAVCYFLC